MGFCSDLTYGGKPNWRKLYCRIICRRISCCNVHKNEKKKKKEAGAFAKLGSQKRLAGLSKGDYGMRDPVYSLALVFIQYGVKSEIPGNISSFSGRVKPVISNAS